MQNLIIVNRYPDMPTLMALVTIKPSDIPKSAITFNSHLIDIANANPLAFEFG